ncbi:IS110 family transposase [Amycolatopsis vastitatis]|nr:IS110 family transposase [Amycolatopsis vastitatis]
MTHPATTDQNDSSPEVILGVDTHKDIHVAAVISIHGALLGSRSFPTTAEGTVPRSVFPARHAGLRSGEMGNCE